MRLNEVARRRPPATGVEQHLSMREVAARLDCHVNTIGEYCRNRLMPHIKLPGKNGKVLIPVSALASFLDDHRVPTRAEVGAILDV